MIRMDEEEKERLHKMRPTLRELRIIDLMRDYSAVRKRYFGKLIPPVEDVAFAFVTGNGMKTIFDENCLGFNVYGPRYSVGVSIIVIAESSRANEVRMTLIHEMAHIKIEQKWKRDMGHGKHWKAEMKRLAAKGAFEEWW